jgi:hypothetical protein
MDETTLEQRIECQESRRILARITVQGIKFWCNKHNRQELITWKQLDILRNSLVSHATTVIQ